MGVTLSASHALAPEVLESAMRRALELAQRGPAQNINPQVGCVIVGPDGETVAEGWHEGAGTAHAEIVALGALPAAWRDRAAELTAVVSLEPCNHTGRTGPCSVALIEAGIGAVAFGLADPGKASSDGSATLRTAGVTVIAGVLENEVRAMLTPWILRHGEGGPARVRPHITVKWAQTLDGRAAAADGSSQWITGSEARADVHRRRAAADAILVGTGTLYADDPALTARSDEPGAGGLLVPPGEQPIPVVVGHREIPGGARVLEHPALHAEGPHAEPIRLTGDDLEADMRELASLGIRSVFVEGGPKIVSSLIAAGLVDELVIYIAPALLGGPKVALGDIGVSSMSEIKHLRVTQCEQLGPDLVLTAKPHPPTLPKEER